MNELIELSYLPAEHEKMVKDIKEFMPEYKRGTSFFNKRQSQFMDNILTVNHPTPIRNLRQILSEMTRSKEALTEAHFNCEKKKVEIKILERDLGKENDQLKREMICLEIEEKQAQLETTKGYVSGAIRRMANYKEQYESICKKHNVSDWNEIDFEKEEEKYHIMKAFDQAICAARAHHGTIDEGNHIYLSQIGINGAAAQGYINQFFALEKKTIKEGKDPTHDMLTNFLEFCYEKFKNSSNRVAEKRGYKSLLNESATLAKGLEYGKQETLAE